MPPSGKELTGIRHQRRGMAVLRPDASRDFMRSCSNYSKKDDFIFQYHLKLYQSYEKTKRATPMLGAHAGFLSHDAGWRLRM
ncbi:MAG: hypothetical protein ACJARE_001771 [Paracoccaceae bacterium]|jgi:hypothetical protein